MKVKLSKPTQRCDNCSFWHADPKHQLKLGVCMAKSEEVEDLDTRGFYEMTAHCDRCNLWVLND